MSTQTSNTIFGFELGFKIDKRLTKWLGILMGDLIAMILVGWLILIPRFNAIQVNLEQIEIKRELLTNLQNKLGLIDDFGVDFAGKDGLIENVFMADRDSGLALAAMRQIADASGMSISNYRIGPSVLVSTAPTVATGRVAAAAAAAASSVNFVEMELTVDGVSANVGPFLRMINESLPIKKVSDLVVSSGSLLDTGQSLQLKLKVNTYFFPAKVQANALSLLKPFNSSQMELTEAMSVYRQVTKETIGAEATLGNSNFFGF